MRSPGKHGFNNMMHAMNEWKKKEKTSEGKKRKKKIERVQSVYASRALCIIVLRSKGSDLSVILRGLKY